MHSQKNSSSKATRIALKPFNEACKERLPLLAAAVKNFAENPSAVNYRVLQNAMNTYQEAKNNEPDSGFDFEKATAQVEVEAWVRMIQNPEVKLGLFYKTRKLIVAPLEDQDMVEREGFTFAMSLPNDRERPQIRRIILEKARTLPIFR